MAPRRGADRDRLVLRQRRRAAGARALGEVLRRLPRERPRGGRPAGRARVSALPTSSPWPRGPPTTLTFEPTATRTSSATSAPSSTDLFEFYGLSSLERRLAAWFVGRYALGGRRRESPRPQRRRRPVAEALHAARAKRLRRPVPSPRLRARLPRGVDAPGRSDRDGAHPHGGGRVPERAVSDGRARPQARRRRTRGHAGRSGGRAPGRGGGWGWASTRSSRRASTPSSTSTGAAGSPSVSGGSRSAGGAAPPRSESTASDRDFERIHPISRSSTARCTLTSSPRPEPVSTWRW